MVSTKKTLYIISLVLIILLGIYFRFQHLDLTRFEHEMVRDIEISSQIVDRNYIFHGVLPKTESQAQNTFGPLSYYLMALGLIFSPNIYFYSLTPIWIIALLDLLGAFIAYKIGKEFFNTTIGILTLSFYLLSPWQIIHVATVLSPTSFMPLFVLLFFYSAFKLLIHKEDIYIIPAILFLSLQMQLHLTSLLLAFTFLLTLILFKRNVNKKYFFIGILLALLAFTPYIYHNLPDNLLGSQYNLITQRAESTFVRTTLESFGTPALFITPYLGAFTLGKDISPFQNNLFDYYFLFLTGIFLVLFILSFIYFLRKIWNNLPNYTTSLKKTISKLETKLQENKKLRTYITLFIFFITPLLIFSIKGSNVTPHYFIIVFPLQIIILSIFLNSLLKKNKTITLCLIILLLLSNTLYLFSYYNFVETNGGTQGITGLTYANKMEVVHYILQDNQPELPIVYYKGQKPLIRSFNYFFELYDRKPNHQIIEHISDFEKGYLILDRYSFYSTFTGTPLPREDYPIIDTLEIKNFKHIEVIKKA